MAIKKYKPTSPARRFMSVSTYEEITTTTPEKSLLTATSAAATASSIVSSTSNATRAFPQRSPASNTIPTVPQTSLCFTTPTAKRDTFLRP